MQYPAISHYHYCVKTNTNTNTTSNIRIITYLINVQLRNLAQAGYTCRLTDWDGPASILEERHRMESSTAVYSLQIMIILSLQISSGIGMKLVLSFGDPEEGLFIDTEIQPQPESLSLSACHHQSWSRPPDTRWWSREMFINSMSNFCSCF